MSEYDSINTMITVQRSKLEQLQQAIKLIPILRDDKHAVEQFKNKQASLQRIIHKLDQLKEERNKQKSLCDALQAQSSVLSQLNQRIEYADKYLSENGLLDQDNRSFMSEISSTNDKSPLEAQVSTTSYEYTPIQEPSVNVQWSSKLKPTELKLRMLDIDLLTQEEFSAVPKYMLGRLSLDTINRFIEVINQTVSAKYQLLSKPKSSLKPKDLQAFRDFKAQETADTKGKTFITEADLAKQQGKKNLDKITYNLITILRHVKRLYEYRSAGTVKYVIILP